MDIWDPLSTLYLLGHMYFLTIVDYHIRFSWVYLMKYKYETSNFTQLFASYVHIQLNHKIKIIRYDNGLEFTLKDFYLKQGIHYQTSCIDTPPPK